MNRIILISVFILGLVASPALAGDVPAETQTSEPVAEKVRKERPRQSTYERWRGGPRGQRASNEVLRAEALNKMLPPANRAFNGGASLGGF